MSEKKKKHQNKEGKAQGTSGGCRWWHRLRCSCNGSDWTLARAVLERLIKKSLTADLIIEELGTTSSAERIGVSFGLEVLAGEVSVQAASNGSSFDTINDEAAIYILNFLGSYDRLPCVVLISKSWYSLGHQSALWQQLDIGRESDCLRSLNHLYTSSKGLQVLIQNHNLIAPKELTCRGCKTPSGADHVAWKVFLKFLLCPLTKLVISGSIRKIKVLNSLADKDLDASQVEPFSVLCEMDLLLAKMSPLTVSITYIFWFSRLDPSS